MAYVDVKNQFLGLLNRRDVTPSLTNTFMQFGIQRIQRELRVPAMEKLAVFVTDGTYSVAVPGDYLEMISIYTNTTTSHKRLTRVDAQTILDYSKQSGIPQYYSRIGGNFVVGPVPPSDTNIFIYYYADASALVADSDTNWITEVAPTLLIYAALSYASDYFLDDRKQMFEASYMQIAEQLQNMALQDELENASVSSAYDTAPNYVGPFFGW
jgi:hypothetical protein